MTRITFSKRIAGGRGLAPVLVKRAATLELDWDVRQKSRFEATDSNGEPVGVFLPRGTVLRGGDVLVGEDGSLRRVIAAPQPVLRITTCSVHGSPFDLTRAAYHLGNRHVPIDLTPTHLQIEPDHVLADLLRSMHLTVTAMDAPFEPEGGAYAAEDHGRGHAPGDGHGHGHGHGHDRPSGHVPADTAPPHVHGPDCDHGHDHGHAHHPAPLAQPVQFHRKRPD